MKRTRALVWRSVKETFTRAKDVSALSLPSLSRLFADISGLAAEFEEVEDAQEALTSTAGKLDELIGLANELNARVQLTSETRSRLEQLNMDIKKHHRPILDNIKELNDPDYLKRAAAAREVTKNIAKIVGEIHGDILIPLIKIVNIARQEDIIQKELRPVDMAAVLRIQDRGCMAGTRTAILARLLAWAVDPAEVPVFWLSGMAGVGKTAIAQSVCDLLHTKGVFAPTFFCSRRTLIEDHQDATRIIPTLSALMARQYPVFMSALLSQLSALRPDRQPLSLDLKEQFRILLQAPLLKSFTDPCSVIFVVDALDELKDRRLMGDFLDGLLSVADSLPVKFLLTSRPEDQIRFRLPDRPSKLHSILRLHDVEEDLVKEDIRLYLRQKLHDPIGGVTVSGDSQNLWFNDDQLERLVTLSNNLFLYASTVVKYVMEQDHEQRLETLLQAQNNMATASIDDTYRFILRTAFPPQRLEPWERKNRNQCLATLICGRRPFSMQDMAGVLDMTEADVRAAFRPLHAVVKVPTRPTEFLSTFHASFQEYLTDTTRSADETWFVNESQTHLDLTSCCLRIISCLHFNITRSASSYAANTDQHGDGNIHKALSYGCQYGIEHLVRSHSLPVLLVRFGECLREKFLYWLEVLSVVGFINEASRLLMEFITAIDVQVPFTRPDIREFLMDGNTFVVRFQEPLSLSAPHIYISALPFTEPDSRIAQTFRHSFSRTLKPTLTANTPIQQPLFVLRSHIGPVNSVGFSPDSTSIVSGSDDKTIRVWDAKTGKEACEPLEGHTRRVTSVMFSSDSRRIVSGSSDQTVRVWDARTGKAVCQPFRGHVHAVLSVAFAHDSTCIVSGSEDKTIRVWDPKTGKELCKPLEGQMRSVRCVALSLDSTRIVSGSTDRTIRVWDRTTGKEVCKALEGHMGVVTSVAFSADSTRLVSCSEDKTIRFWNAKTGKEVCKALEGHMGLVTSAVFSADSTRLVSGSWDKTVRVWDAKTGKQVCEPLEGHTEWVQSVAFSPDSERIVSGSTDSTIRVWDVTRVGEAVSQPFKGHARAVMSVAFSHDSTHIVSGSEDNTIRVWEAKTGKEVCKLEGHTDVVTSVAFSPNSTCIVSGSRDKSIRVWDAETGKEVCEPLKGHTRIVTCVKFSPDSRRVASASGDRTIRVWDVKTWKEVCKLEGHTEMVSSIAFSPDSARIVSGSRDKTIRVWDAETGKEVCEPLKGHAAWIGSVAFSPNSMRIASGSNDETIRVWDTNTWENVCEPLEGHTNWVWSVAFSPDSERIVSGSYDNTIRVWDCETGKEACEPLMGHRGRVACVAFSPDSLHIVSGSHDNTIRVWDARMGKQLCEPLHDDSSEIASITASPDATRVVWGSADNMSRATAVVHRPTHFLPQPKHSGWQVSSSGQLLFWVPSEFRLGLYTPRTTLVIGARPCALDLTSFTQGEEWTRCYEGPEQV